MANINFLKAFPTRIYDNPDSEITREDFIDVIESKENILFYDYYTKLQYENVKTKMKMMKKINSVYKTGESYDYSESREGIVSGLIKIFVETIKFIVKIAGIIIKGIFKFFVNLFIKKPLRRLDEKRVYKAYLQRKKARSSENYNYYSLEKDLDPHRPTGPSIADINKYMDYHVGEVIGKIFGSENKNVRKLSNAIFHANKNDTICVENVIKFGKNACKVSEEISKDTNRFITNEKSHMNRDKSHEDDHNLQDEGKNINDKFNSKEFSLFDGIDTSEQKWSNEKTCARRIVDFMVEFPMKIIKVFSEVSQLLKGQSGVMDKLKNSLETILQNSEKTKNIEKETVNVTKAIANNISNLNKCFMCFGDISRVIHDCLSKFEEHKEDYKERTGSGKF